MTAASATASDFLQRYQPSQLELRLGWQRRITAGVLYGLLLSSLYALVSGIINLIAFPNLPLGMDWAGFAQKSLYTVLGGLALSVLTAWPAAPWKGILMGTAAVVASELLRSFVSFGSEGLIFLLLALPLMVVSFPIAAVFRGVVQLHMTFARGRRIRRLGLVLAVIALGIFAGTWSRMPPYAEASVRQVHNILRTTLANPEGNLPAPLRSVPDFRYRAGQAYRLTQRASAASPTGVEVQAAFDNGYLITCFVETTTGSAACTEGSQSPFGASRYNAVEQR